MRLRQRVLGVNDEDEAELPTVNGDVSLDASALRPVLAPCLCGGEITAYRMDPTLGVMAHNRTLTHLIWRLYERPLEPLE